MPSKYTGFCIERYIGCQLFWFCCRLANWGGLCRTLPLVRWEGCAVFGIFRLDELQMPWWKHVETCWNMVDLGVFSHNVSLWIEVNQPYGIDYCIVFPCFSNFARFARFPGLIRVQDHVVGPGTPKIGHICGIAAGQPRSGGSIGCRWTVDMSRACESRAWNMRRETLRVPHFPVMLARLVAKTCGWRGDWPTCVCRKLRATRKPGFFHSSRWSWLWPLSIT